MTATPLRLPPEDRDLSPYTGWTRDHWVALAEHLLLSVRPYASPGRARIDLPGPSSSSGAASDGLEGFARTFLLAGFLVAGNSGADPHRFLDWYRAGLAAGTDPSGEERWPRPDRLDQAKVEAASIALVLLLTRPWLWDRMSPAERDRVLDWMSAVVGRSYPPINWVWFQVIAEEFLRQAGGPWSRADIDSGLAVHAGLARAGGWYSDGPERSYDYYCGWALHFYPLVWSSLAAEPPGTGTVERWRADLSRFLEDHIRLIGADGGPVLQGRSLIYRMAAAAPLWVGAWSGATALAPGRIRRAASGILRHFHDRGAPDRDGLLPLGWHHSWPAMRQTYSGGGSPYWASKGFFGLVLPPEHPVWTSREEPLPVEEGDDQRVVRAPGWILSATARDGLVRVVNHGTDHAEEGDLRTDSPLYARLGYSSATVPPLIGDTLDSPLDNSVAVLDEGGAATHRTGFTSLGVVHDGAVPVGGSRWRAHWVAADPGPGRDHGSGRRGEVRLGPTLEVWSLVRGPDEVRVVRVGGEPVGGGCDRWRLRVGGWPVAGGGGPESVVEALTGPHAGQESGTADLGEAGPLAGATTVPWVCADAAPGEVLAFLVRLGADAAAAPRPRVRIEASAAVVTWPDGTGARVALHG
ncbi:DUF2264 domain-containing protein [Streptomonospora sp. PA3]|uniref:DUF2264 domain-containing protein n=1 Tax=Streptomonospora sp. PA3 TaxID=2607326 RepID=UPI0012DC0450|nr:DUF2264 domain-containing protein [Streptomonospora sp. PA3]MUL41205.1 DUF2264 domain-containing protein [Streptomonospora sp. PA3]